MRGMFREHKLSPEGKMAIVFVAMRTVRAITFDSHCARMDVASKTCLTSYLSARASHVIARLPPRCSVYKKQKQSQIEEAPIAHSAVIDERKAEKGKKGHLGRVLDVSNKLNLCRAR